MSEKKNTNRLNILGMMSGTSGDGIDGSLVSFDESGSFKLLWHDSHNFSDEARLRIKNLMIEASASDVLLGGAYIAELYAEACQAFFRRNQDQPDYIAAHGQTILHLPQLTNWDGYNLNGSLQLMNGSILAQKTHFPVICNFREADMAAGGQGAPLVPFADACFFGENLGKDRIILNVGGIANFTVLKRVGGRTQVATAFDTGPGNMLMDAYCEMISAGAKTFDKDGLLASSGKVIESVVHEVLSDPYFSAPPPKSTGREKFGIFRLKEILQGIPESASENDVMSTLLEITVRGIVEAVLGKHGQIDFPADLIVAGGGALNSELVRRLQNKLCDKCVVLTSDECQIPVMAREAMAFAALGNAFVRRIPANVPCATGALSKVILGELHPV